MPYIIREDGEHFVIPSYRDVLTAKQKSQLKKDILLLSQSYGEYITLQRKGPMQYEVAFSPDTGYLLGESIWHYFKRPLDLIYCEAIPNTSEAILVIVKNGSVYLDGSFPLESIPEELIIFLTQQNNFEIYTYGDVPISEAPEEGKFSFETSSVKSFTVLEKPIFQTLPLLRIYQLQLVDQVLKAQGIGVFPLRQLLIGLILIGLGWMIWSYLTVKAPEIVPLPSRPTNPYQGYNLALISPAPDQEMKQLMQNLRLLMTAPGWWPVSVTYSRGNFNALMKTTGSKAQSLLDWAKLRHVTINVVPEGIYAAINFTLPNRPIPTKIYPLKEVIAQFVDRLASVYPGNHLTLSDLTTQDTYSQMTITINLETITPMVLGLIGDQFKDLPFELQNVTLTMDNDNWNGSITLEALGN